MENWLERQLRLATEEVARWPKWKRDVLEADWAHHVRRMKEDAEVRANARGKYGNY
jgi:hypothetical protein